MDDHAESVLTFEFGVKSLLLLCVESIENTYDSNSTNPILEEILPLNLKSMLVSRSLFNEGTMLYNLIKCNFEKFAMFQKLTSILFFYFSTKMNIFVFFFALFFLNYRASLIKGTKYQTSRPMLEKPKMFTQSIINVGL